MSWSSAVSKTVLQADRPMFMRPAITPADIDWSRVVTIDFETKWGPDYTLKKMSTSEYVRDPRFKIHMMGIKIGNKKTRIVPGRLVQRELAKIPWSTHALLCHNTAFDGFILSHHFGITPRIYYDTLSMARGLHSNDIGASLDEVAQFYGVGNKIPDVLGQTEGLDDLPKPLFLATAAYCEMDVELCLEIFKRMVPIFPVREMQLVHETINMFCRPVLRVDMPRVQREYAREIAEREALLMSIVDPTLYDEKKLLKNATERALEGKERHMLMVKRIIGSERFADLLRAEGVEPPVKISPAWIKKKPADRKDDEKWAYAFAKDDAAFINLPAMYEDWGSDLDLENPDDVVALAKRQDRLQALIDARIAVKSTTNITRAERFLKAGANGWFLPVGYAYYRAHTGRFGGNNKMNMQNLKRPEYDKMGEPIPGTGELRQSILAPKGHQMVVVDSGQIECRVNGWMWGQDDLISAFRIADKWDKSKGVARGDDRDAYCRFASLIYDREITTLDKTERFVGKVCVLGLGYQMGAAKLQITLAKGALGGPPIFLPLDMCKKIVNTYRRANHKIQSGWAICAGIIEDMASGRTGAYKCISWEKETIWLPNGMSLKYPNLKKGRNEDSGYEEWTYESTVQGKVQTKKIYGGLLCENLIQALARIIICDQILDIAKSYRVVMTTHDEAVAVAPTRSAPKCFATMVRAFTTPPAWCRDLPLSCEGGFAPNYSK